MRARIAACGPCITRKPAVLKNLRLYRLDPATSLDLEAVEAALDEHRFAPCSATQMQSIGWAEPRGVEHGALVESVGGQWLLLLKIEAKVLPAAVVQRKVDEMAASIEAERGRKPGKKERRELKDEATLTLLPQAFTKQASVRVWIAPATRLLALDAASQARADAVTTCLLEAMPSWRFALIQTEQSPAAAMADWLTEKEAPGSFMLGQACELKASDAGKATVRYAKHPLTIDEIGAHIAQGKLPTQVALEWAGRVAFTLTEAMQLKKIAFLEGVFDGAGDAQADDKLDADLAIATGELSQLIPELLEALGGETEPA